MDKIDSQNSVTRIWGLLKDFLDNKLEYARLSGAEKTTVMLSGIALVLAVFMFALFFVFFLSLALSQWIASAIGEGWSYLIISGIYAALIALLILFRKPLIQDPIARFVSKIFL